ncbi:aminoglycoside phosphotransferase family protein [Desulfovibrio aminophilus]|nr:phosphotransferase [Desulfovibrio aminophilus]MCM0756710.1 aminoglycoside phosphotransferase family protein [Desulfovibrio aminophilus]
MLDLIPSFGLIPGRLRRDIPLPGSPERCRERLAVEDAEGRLWMLERLAPGQAARREEVAALLDALAARGDDLRGLIPAYRPLARGGGHILRVEDGPRAGDWQLSPCVRHAPLPRPGYLDDAWRGAAAAGFLLALEQTSRGVAVPPAPVPPLSAYIRDLTATASARNPGLGARLEPALAALADLPEIEASLPQSLAHGDLHPLNILWGPDGGGPIRAVIDWEFAGARPPLTDAANCLGCVGFEHPSGLGRGFALGLMRELRRGGTPEASLARLPVLVLASRFGWLSEWLRKRDREMLDMELDYLDILTSERDRLAALWSGR